MTGLRKTTARLRSDISGADTCLRAALPEVEHGVLTLDVGTSLASLHTLQVGIQTRDLAVSQGIERVHRDASVVVVARVTMAEGMMRWNVSVWALGGDDKRWTCATRTGADVRFGWMRL